MTRVIATFDSPDAMVRGIDTARRAGGRAIDLCSPAFDEKLLQLVGATRSPVSAVAFVAGVGGALAGLLLTIGTVRQWPGLIVSGKPLVSIPPFLIITFELAILFASIAAVATFLVAARRARRIGGVACNAATTDARFTVLFEFPAALQRDQAMPSLGALEWRVA